MLLGTPQPVVGCRCYVFIDPVMALVPTWRVDHPGNVAGGTEDEPLRTFQQCRAGIGTAPGHYVVVVGPQDVRWCIYGAQIQLDAAQIQLP
ncbi:hypothetical protein G6F24_014126 [Rhizopus arrhizus]|nr:hypothetical protein G6F24_014126 [Rhizopus arrhizus]